MKATKKDLIDDIIKNYKNYGDKKYHEAPYDFLKDDDILLGLEDTILNKVLTDDHSYLDSIPLSFKLEPYCYPLLPDLTIYSIPVFHKWEFAYYTRIKACFYADRYTNDEGNLMFGVNSQGFDIYSYRLNSPWQKLYTFLRGKNLAIKFRVFFEENDKVRYSFNVYEVAGTYSKTKYVDKWVLNYDMSYKFLIGYTEGKILNELKEQDLFKIQYLLLKKIYRKIVNLNSILKSHTEKDQKAYYIIKNIPNFNLNTIYSTDEKWIKFDWDILNSFDLYKSYLNHQNDQGNFVSDQFFLKASSSLIASASISMKIKESFGLQ